MNHQNGLEQFRDKVEKLDIKIRENKILEQVRDEKENLALSETDRYSLCKLRIAELMLHLRNKILFHFGMLVILGWQEEWTKEWVSSCDRSQNIFKEKRFDILSNSIFDVTDKFLQVIQFDGAILIDNMGIVTNSGMFVEGLRPTDVAEKLKLPEEEDLSSRFGFKTKVHTRHLSAISVSYQLKDTTVYTISRKTNDLRIFEKGKIVYSTAEEE